MYEIALPAQRIRAQRLCNLATYSRVAYTLPDPLLTSRVGNTRIYWVRARFGDAKPYTYGLSADDGSYKGHWPTQDPYALDLRFCEVCTEHFLSEDMFDEVGCKRCAKTERG